jgi:hypothetical protein
LRYSTGDRVGCGVLTDGTVYFTLNGIFLGFPGAPKVDIDSAVSSVVTATGYDAHVRFIFNQDLFMFDPEIEDFEVCEEEEKRGEERRREEKRNVSRKTKIY